MRRLVMIAALAGCGPAEALRPDAAIDAPAPDAAPGIDAASACSATTHSGCAQHEKCAWIWDSVDDPATPDIGEVRSGHLACVTSGFIPVGEACLRSGPHGGTGAGVADECGRGAYCHDGFCRAVCNPAFGDDWCSSGEACATLYGPFDDNGESSAGICVAECNPLTQVDLATGSDACGSTDVAAPDRGCYQYGRNGVFSCQRIPAAAKGRVDTDQALGPPGGGAYATGCEAGYLPAWFDNEDNTVNNCAGICAAVPVDSARPELAAGYPGAVAKLHDQPAPRVGDGVCEAGKKGNGEPEDCRFIIFGTTVGVCLPFGAYTYDHDSDLATPEIVEPSCAELPPAGADPGSTIHNITADQAGCYGALPTRTHTGRPTSGRAFPHVLR